MFKSSQQLTKAVSVILILLILLGMIPPATAFAQEVSGNDQQPNLIYFPFIGDGSAATQLQGPESEAYRQFETRVKDLVDTLSFEFSPSGKVQIHGELPIKAAASEVEQAFQRDITALISLIQSDQLTMTMTSPTPVAEDEVTAAFDWINRPNSLYVALYASELKLLEWALGDAIAALVGAVVTAFTGGALTIGAVAGWFFAHYLQDQIIGSGLPTYLRFSLFKGDMRGWFSPTPFYIYIEKPGDMCHNRWRRWWLKFYWWWYIEPDRYCLF